MFALCSSSASGQSPQNDSGPAADYVLSRLATNSVVLLGEAHWIRQDAELLANVVREMPARGFYALAIEWIPASEQPSIDTLLKDALWNRSRAIKSLRIAAWPYEEYLEILHAAWAANQRPSTDAFRVFALGPGEDWRARLLPLGRNYETFMADTIVGLLKAGHKPILVSLGMHHSFTRHYLPDLPERFGQKTASFGDRTGNILRRTIGERVFQIALGYPWTCWTGDAWGKCLPLDGAIDCAMQIKQRPSAIDIASSPWRDMIVRKEFWFALGYPVVRFGDLADGYIWQGPLESLKNVRLIPLDEFAPDSASLAEVAVHPPFGDAVGLSRTALRNVWSKEYERIADPITARGWTNLRAWKESCPSRD